MGLSFNFIVARTRLQYIFTSRRGENHLHLSLCLSIFRNVNTISWNKTERSRRLPGERLSRMVLETGKEQRWGARSALERDGGGKEGLRTAFALSFRRVTHQLSRAIPFSLFYFSYNNHNSSTWSLWILLLSSLYLFSVGARCTLTCACLGALRMHRHWRGSKPPTTSRETIFMLEFTAYVDTLSLLRSSRWRNIPKTCSERQCERG